MHRDTVIGIVGVVILVAAMVGVFTYERSQASSQGEADGGTLQTLAGPDASGTVAVGATEDKILAFNQTGITNVTFTLTWTPGQASSVDTLRLVVAPGNDTGLTSGFESEAEDDGEITLTIPVANVGPDGILGVGNWQVTVEFVSAAATTPVGQPPLPPPTAPPGTTDTSVDYALATSLQAYGSAA